MNGTRPETRFRAASCSRCWLTLVSLAAVWIALAIWQHQEHAREERRHRHALAESGRARIAMIEATLRTVGRRRREEPGYLAAVLEEVVKAASMRGAWLVAPGGEPIGAHDDPRDFPPPREPTVERWMDDELLIGRSIDMTLRRMEPGGLGHGRDARGESAFLYLAIDRGEMDRELAADSWQRVVALAIAALAALATFLVLRQRARARDLDVQLHLSLERANHLRELNLLAAGLAHETKNPLAVIRGLAARACEEKTDSGDFSLGARILEQVDRIAARVNELLRFSRPQEPRWAPVSLPELFAELETLLEPDLGDRGAFLDTRPLDLTITADAEMIRQILLNLLVNAIASVRPEGRVSLRATDEGEGRIALLVEDDGTGIPQEAIDRVFEPYYSGREGGTGLGLAIVGRLVEALGWKVEMTSSSGAGTRVRIDGPRRCDAASQERDSPR